MVAAFIGRLKVAVTRLLTETFIASSIGPVAMTRGRVSVSASGSVPASGSPPFGSASSANSTSWSPQPASVMEARRSKAPVLRRFILVPVLDDDEADDELDASIGHASGVRTIGGVRVRRAEALVDEPIRGDSVANQVVEHRLGAGLGQRLVVGVAALGRGVPVDLDLEAAVVLQGDDDLVEQRVRRVLELCRVPLERDVLREHELVRLDDDLLV